MSTQAMEPMDSKLCVLLELELISSPGTYSQSTICSIIAQNSTAFSAIYNNPSHLQNAVNTYMSDVRRLDIVDKAEDCG